MMMLRSSTSKYLIAACVCVMVALGVAKGKDKASEQCNAVLVISAVTQSNSEGNGNIHVRSLSPWTWKFSTVENRIPSTIWEAECSSSHCSSPNNPIQPGAFTINSVPIYQQVLVLSLKESCYTAFYQTVAVGCTCVWAKTAIN